MRKFVLTTTSLMVLAGVSVPAFAQEGEPTPTWYYGIKGGLTRPLDADFDRNDNGNFAYRVDPKLGWAVLGHAGYDMGRIRLEAELGYHQSSVDSVWIADPLRVSPPGVYDDPDGKVKLYNIMANVLFDIVEWQGFTFSAGGGAGYGMVSLKNVAATDGAPHLVDKADKEFMWQAIGALSMPLNERIDLTADYRYLQTGKLDLIPENGDVKGKYKTHMFLIGARFKLGGAEPAPEPAPPPPPAP
ncbi:MAG TPA: outer membrane beta-barrel protein, partial [Pedomonas sp.]|uniref:outer membrane protein n=1 Tax=Pedomonas sp. TaxID=2976421 RepID=UPI002F3E38BA